MTPDVLTESIQNCDSIKLWSSTIEHFALLVVLSRCRTHVSTSVDSDWSCLDVKGIVKMLDRSIQALEDSVPVEIDELRVLFLPTGPLQETAMSNGWAEEYLALATRFDEIIDESS